MLKYSETNLDRKKELTKAYEANVAAKKAAAKRKLESAATAAAAAASSLKAQSSGQPPKKVQRVKDALPKLYFRLHGEWRHYHFVF